MSTERDSYLLRAPKGDLARWKNEARKRKIPFSQFCREALEAHAEQRPKVGVTVPPQGVRDVAAAQRHARAREATERATGRPFRPDFKGGVANG
jgi:hypothetical protein